MDYNEAKFIFFTDTQYAENDNGVGSVSPNQDGSLSGNMQYFLDAGANGYVLAPITPNFYINNIKGSVPGSNTTYMDRCIAQISDFINSVIAVEPAAKFWIGTPSINSNNANYFSNSSLYGTYLATLIDYANALKDKLSGNVWNNNVQGLYFNQESIYTPDFNVNNLSANDEFRVINDFSYYVHSSMPTSYGSDTRVAYNKDLIWIPYLPILSNTAENNTREANIFRRIGKIIESSTCFDCAFIQPHLSGLYNDDEYEGVYYNINAYVLGGEISDETAFLKNKGELNITTLCNSLDEEHLLYRDGARVVADSEVINSTRKCALGVEYELNGTYEHVYIKNTTLSLFEPYRKFDKYVGTKPILFYWQGEEVTSFVAGKIKAIYSPNENNDPKETSVDNSNGYVAALTNTVYRNYMPTLYNTLNTPSANTTSLTVTNGQFSGIDIYELANNLSALFTAEYPDKYWVDSLDVAVTAYNNDDTVKSVQISVNSSMNLATEQNNNVPFRSQVNNLRIYLSTLAGTDAFARFLNAHNWLVDNVTYVETSGNPYHNCAYGAIMSDIHTATSKGFSAALKLLCSELGVPCLIVPGSKGGRSHYWNYVKLDNKWWFVDASLNTPINGDTYKYKYFLRKTPDSYFRINILPNATVSEDSYILYGDADQNGIITANDAALIQQCVLDASTDISPAGRIAADVDGNGNITSNDIGNVYIKVSNNAFELPVESKIKGYN